MFLDYFVWPKTTKFPLFKTNEVKFWLTIYSYFDASMILVIIIKKNKYLKKSHKIK
jgi:hypothetical protein